MENLIENIKKIIEKLPHSRTRVPYTYHHDYLRWNSPIHSKMSRSEVSENSCNDDEELYSVALCQLLTELGPNVFLYMNGEDVEVCKQAVLNTQAIINSYN